MLHQPTMSQSFFSTYKQHQIQLQAEFFSLFYLENIKRFHSMIPNSSNRCQTKCSISIQWFLFSLKQKDTPFFFSHFPKSISQSSRFLKTMTLYSENNAKNCCKFVVCSSKLLLYKFGNNDQYNGIALRSQIKLTMKRLIHPLTALDCDW